MVSRPPIIASIILNNDFLSHDSYVEQYVIDEDFKEVFEKLTHGARVENCCLQGKLLYHLGKLCIPTSEQVHVIRETHTSLVSGNFGVRKTMAHLQRFCYWPRMKAIVTKYVKGCVMCSTCKPTNRKLGLYSPLHVPSHPWESISMDFFEGLPMLKRGDDYLYVVVDRFSKMCILMSCKKKIITKQTINLLFQYVWVHFGLPTSIISDRDTRFLGDFWTSLWRMMDTKLKRSTYFHPHIDEQTEVVNRTLVLFLRGYCNKHPKLWDEQIPYVQQAYNRALHSSTQCSPFETCFGYLPKVPLDLMYGRDSK
jgi:hypothetical protein